MRHWWKWGGDLSVECLGGKHHNRVTHLLVPGRNLQSSIRHDPGYVSCIGSMY
jgi:hypothetical protein